MLMNDDVSHQDEDDKDFNQTLSDLYRAALLDENFQQQVGKDLHTLSAEARASLKTAEQAFLDDGSPSEEARVRLLDKMAAPASMPANAGVSQNKKSWWQKLLGGRTWGNSLLPRPVFSIPAAMMAGVVLGVLLPTLLSSLMEPVHQTRGGTSKADTAQTGSSPAGSIPDAVRQDPQQWLKVIGALVVQGRLAEARAEMDAFENEHPGYQPEQ